MRGHEERLERTRINRRGVRVDENGRRLDRRPDQAPTSLFPCAGCEKPTTRKHEGTRGRVWCNGCWLKLPPCVWCKAKGQVVRPPKDGGPAVEEMMVCPTCEGTGKAGA